MATCTRTSATRFSQLLSLDFVSTNQSQQVLVLRSTTSQFIELLKNSLLLYLTHFVATMIGASTGKAHPCFYWSSLALVSRITLSPVLLKLSFLSCPVFLVPQSLLDSPAPGVEASMYMRVLLRACDSIRARVIEIACA